MQLAKRSRSYSLLGLLAIPLALIWNFPNRNLIFGMDDPGLLNFLNSDVGIIDKTINNFTFNRWRPLASFAYYLSFRVAGFDYNQWWMIMTLLLGIIGFLVYFIIFEFSDSIFLPLVGMVLAVTHRQAYYLATQATGIMESLAVIGVLLIFFFLLKFGFTRKVSYLNWAIFIFFLVCLLHERFQFLFLVLLWATLASRFIERNLKLLLSFLILVPILLPLVLKIERDIPFLIGTGSTTELGFSPVTAISFLFIFIINALGINYGENYLFGYTIALQGPIDVFISISIAALVFVTLVIWILRIDFTSKFFERKSFGLLFSFFWLPALLSGLVVPSISTIRIEPRWIYGASLILLILMAITLNQYTKFVPFVGWVGLFIVVALTVRVNSEIRNKSEQVYFVQHQTSGAAYLSIFEPVWNNPSVVKSGITIYDARSGLDYGMFLNNLITGNTGFSERKIVTVFEPQAPDIKQPGATFVLNEATGGLELKKIE